MENKTPLLTKLVLIFESSVLVITLLAFYFFRERMGFPEGLLWLWSALLVFSSVSFLFLLIVFIITLVKRSLRITYWAPISFVSCIAFLILALLIFAGPSVMQPQFIDFPVEEVETVSGLAEQDEKSEVEKVETETTVETEESEEKAETNIFEVGETFKIGDLQFTINGVRTLEADKYDNRPSEEGYIFLFIDTTIENLGNKEVYIHPDNNFRLVDENGRDYNFVWAEGRGSIEGVLASERKISGEQSYGIPKDINEYELEVFNHEIFESEIAIVRISTSQ